jgi:hypothetical protein
MPTTAPSPQSTGISRFTRPKPGAILDWSGLRLRARPQSQYKGAPHQVKGRIAMRVSPDTATNANRLGARKSAESRTSFLLMRRVRGRQQEFWRRRS